MYMFWCCGASTFDDMSTHSASYVMLVFPPFRGQPKCITDLTAVYLPELDIPSGHIACSLCGAVEQAHLIKALNVMHVK
jgi:hypothetical protein